MHALSSTGPYQATLAGSEARGDIQSEGPLPLLQERRTACEGVIPWTWAAVSMTSAITKGATWCAASARVRAFLAPRKTVRPHESLGQRMPLAMHPGDPTDFRAKSKKPDTRHIQHRHTLVSGRVVVTFGQCIPT
jgi:hypothetical protein